MASLRPMLLANLATPSQDQALGHRRRAQVLTSPSPARRSSSLVGLRSPPLVGARSPAPPAGPRFSPLVGRGALPRRPGWDSILNKYDGEDAVPSAAGAMRPEQQPWSPDRRVAQLPLPVPDPLARLRLRQRSISKPEPRPRPGCPLALAAARGSLGSQAAAPRPRTSESLGSPAGSGSGCHGSRACAMPTGPHEVPDILKLPRPGTPESLASARASTAAPTDASCRRTCSEASQGGSPGFCAPDLGFPVRAESTSPAGVGSAAPAEPGTAPAPLAEVETLPAATAPESWACPGSGAPSGASTPSSVSSPAGREVQRLLDGEKIYDRYSWDEVLQEQGDGGKVVVCRPKGERAEGPAEFVMKIRAKESLRQCHVNMESQFRRVLLRMMNLPPHRSVMELQEVLEDDRFYYVVMRRAVGGPLLEGLLGQFTSGVIPAPALKLVMREILQGLGHIHRHSMLHRDIKPDNLVVHHSDGRSPTSGGCPGVRVMLIDFDMADPDWKHDRWALACSFAGTVRFSAPEALLGRYSPQSDLYGVGMILYLLMTGTLPYDDDVFQDPVGPDADREWHAIIRNRMAAAEVDWRRSPWPHQPLCRDLCERLLRFQPEERIATAAEALEHTWFSSSEEEALEN